MNSTVLDIVRLRKVLAFFAIAMPLACIFVAFIFDGWAVKRFLIFYLAPILSMAAVWTSIKIRSLNVMSWLEIVIDGLVFIIAMVRFIVGDVIPISGHMLFFAHTIITIKDRWYKNLALIFIMETSYFKLWIWKDTLTWLNGLLLGCASGIIYLIVMKIKNPRKQISTEDHIA